MAAAREIAKKSRGAAETRRRGRCQELVADQTDAGFVAVDALVALAILGATVALSIRTADTARRTASLAAETREAQAILEQTLDSSTLSPGTMSGRSGSFEWKLLVSPLALPNGASQVDRLCQRTAEVRRIEDGRAFRASTVRPCPPQEGPR